MHIQSLDGEWQASRNGADEWIPVTVPGSIHVDLIKQGLIPDPTVGDNEVKVGWVAESDWLYRTTFRADDELLQCERVFLECDGIDTLSTICLNGEVIANTDNMHLRYRFDVTGRLQAGENTLDVAIASPVEYALMRTAEDEDLVITPSDSIPGSPYIRKAMYQWGWDWGPKIPTSGIWRSIRLAGSSTARIDDIKVTQLHGNTRVEVHLEVQVERFTNAGIMAHARLTSPDGIVLEEEDNLCEDGTCGLIDFLVDNPKLWWPNGMGEHPLYDLEVWLEPASPDEFPEGHEGSTFNVQRSTFDVRRMRIGLRELHLRRDKDEWGESFYFEVNGVPVFAKGANWIPADQFPAQMTDERYRDLVFSAAIANMNMLRVWGGGIYEDDRFYDLCDELGIMVWQDFMFAGAHYPVTEGFLENVRLEAVDNIRRIRHHPCLALWCGNNEMEWFLARGWEPSHDEERKVQYVDLFYELLPSIVAEEDKATPYWSSSPASGEPFKDPNGQCEGDGHYWEVWHGRAPFTAYRQQFFRFMSEFGFQSLPSMNTIAGFAEPKDWNIVSYVMEAHQKSYIGNGQIIDDMMRVFRLPDEFPMLVYVSQVLQAEAIRYGVEHWRRHRNGNRCMGTLYWQLDDCWPVASWSSIEYNHNWKALHYFARRFYAPVLLSVSETPASARVHVTNDTRKPFIGEVRWSLEKTDGTRLDSGRIAVEVPPETSALITSMDFGQILNDANQHETVFVYELWQGNQRMSMAAVSFVPSKYLELRHPNISAEVFEEGGVTKIKLTTDCLARFVMLDVPDARVRFSDNYFDLPAGRTVTVTVDECDGMTTDEISRKLAIISLRQSHI